MQPFQRLIISALFLTGLTSANYAADVPHYMTLDKPAYPSNQDVDCATYIPQTDPGRIRDEVLFGQMYGETEAEVRSHLARVYWMPHYFGYRYPLSVTSVNDVNLHLQDVSDELEILLKRHPEYMKFLDQPSGAFYWRHIQYSNRKSPHSYGIAIDLNADNTNYWLWDTGIQTNRLDQDDNIPYKNDLPCAIVTIFEKNGFIWGGKWKHYDTMHFEYRPELIKHRPE